MNTTLLCILGIVSLFPLLFSFCGLAKWSVLCIYCYLVFVIFRQLDSHLPEFHSHLAQVFI
jgi:hypothetical protein